MNYRYERIRVFNHAAHRTVTDDKRPHQRPESDPDQDEWNLLGRVSSLHPARIVQGRTDDWNHA